MRPAEVMLPIPAQVRCVGNSVSPQVAAAIVRANIGWTDAVGELIDRIERGER